jgi:hypothetical protein
MVLVGHQYNSSHEDHRACCLDWCNHGLSQSDLEHLHQGHGQSSEVGSEGVRQHGADAAPAEESEIPQSDRPEHRHRTTTITNLEFYKLVPRWKRVLYRLHLKKRGEEIHAVLNDYRGPQMPHKLEVGSEWVALMEQDGSFEDWLKTDRLHCAVHHSFSKRPAPSKIIRGPI